MENIMLVILKVFLVVETVKKDLFSSRGKIKANNNNNDNKENIDINIHNSLRDNRQNNRIIQLLEDKENICPNNNINFSIRNVKTGYFGSNQEDEKVQINNSFRPKISKKNSNSSNSPEYEKNNSYKEISFSFSTNTFNNTKKETNLSQSIKHEEIDENKENNLNNGNQDIKLNDKKIDNNLVDEIKENNLDDENKENNISDETKKSNNTKKIKKDNINININNSSNKRKIIIKSYSNKEKKENINSTSDSKKNSLNDDDILYEKIIKKSVTKIEIYDDEKICHNESINKTTKKDLNEEDSITKSSNTSLYNKPIIKTQFNLKKTTKMRPSIDLNLNKSNDSVDNTFPKRRTYSKKMKNCLNKNLSFHIKKVATTGQINLENNTKMKKKNLKTNSFSGTSTTTLGVSRNEITQN